MTSTNAFTKSAASPKTYPTSNAERGTKLKKQQKNQDLRRDIRLLGGILGETLVEQEGQALFELEEKIRKLAIARRRGPKLERSARAEELRAMLSQLTLREVEPVVRAFSVYLQLSNLVEQHHRVRRIRHYALAEQGPAQRGSVREALQTLKTQGVPVERVREALASLQVILTFTAHPSQAARRTVLEKLYRIASQLEKREGFLITPEETARTTRQIREEVTSLWQTDELRRERPSVGDEVKNVLWYVEEVLWDLLPEIPGILAYAFEQAYDEPLGPIRQPVKLHSWVGGDMDGNPLITPEVLEDSIRAHQARGLRRLIADVELLGGALSQSTRHANVSDALTASLQQDERMLPGIALHQGPRTEGEPWRRKMTFVRAKLSATLAAVELRRAGQSMVALPGSYASPAEMVSDLETVVESLQAAHCIHSGASKARALLERVRAAGFHLAELEMRAPAEDARQAWLWLQGQAGPTPGARRFYDCLLKVAQAQCEGGDHACQTLILSMASSADDVLAAWQVASHAKALVDVVPLFELMGALNQAPAVMKTLFLHPSYRAHVEQRGVQEVMIGYSDSSKEVGLLAARAALLEAQTELPKVAFEAGVVLRLFHGRGESVARGGGPSQQAILALPSGSVGGQYKATEQGEALDHKYARPEVARRTLELILGGALIHSLNAQSKPSVESEKEFRAIFRDLAEEGRHVFRCLVWEDPRFPAFFEAVTPIAEISKLPIASRPSKRHSGGMESLRAIPWVFAWTQNRSILPGWYGVGSAFKKVGDTVGGEDKLRQMYLEWPFFRSVLDNIEMVLAKSDIRIASRYAKLAGPAFAPLWSTIRAEHALTVQWVKKIVGSKKLLDGNPTLQRSIRLRNPYVDPMSFLQVELLRRQRQNIPEDSRDAEYDRPLLLTLSGISAGMRNTG